MTYSFSVFDKVWKDYMLTSTCVKKRPKRNETCESPWSSLSASPLREISQTTSHSRPPAPRPWSQRSAWSACHSCWREPVTVSVWYRDQIVRWSSPSTFGLMCWITSRSSSAGWESFFFFFRFNGSLHPAKLHYCHLPGFTATSSPKSSWWIRYFWKTKHLSLHHDLTDQPHFQTCTAHFCPHHLLCLTYFVQLVTHVQSFPWHYTNYINQWDVSPSQRVPFRKQPPVLVLFIIIASLLLIPLFLL